MHYEKQSPAINPAALGNGAMRVMLAERGAAPSLDAERSE
jgi:hypothetical protein